MALFGDDVARTVRAAGADHVILIGHSMGAAVVFEAARQLGCAALGVVVVDMFHKPSAKPPKPPPFDSDAFKAAMLKGMFTANSDSATAMRIIEAMTLTPPQIAMPLREAMEVYDAGQGLRGIASTPVAMILSELRPVDDKEIRALHPNVRISVIPNVGHFLMIEAPAIFNALLRTESMGMAGIVKIM